MITYDEDTMQIEEDKKLSRAVEKKCFKWCDSTSPHSCTQLESSQKHEQIWFPNGANSTHDPQQLYDKILFSSIAVDSNWQLVWYEPHIYSFFTTTRKYMFSYFSLQHL